MKTINLPKFTLLTNNVQPRTASVPPKQVPTTMPGADYSKLVVPGFNDHHVILFGGKTKKSPAVDSTAYKPIDNVEKNSMNIYKNVAPAVVELAVSSTRIVMDPQTGMPKKVPAGGFGSGSILDKEGHIVTNFHVIKDAEEIKIIINKDHEVTAKLVGADPSTDIAVVKIVDMPKEELAKLPVMKIGTSDSVVGGQRAYAVGNPFNLYRTVTQGIVSALDRTIVSPGGRLTKGVVQTDASINPGNSGGALINARGEQIGVNSQIYSPSGASAGLGFAIPIDLAMKVVEDLKTNGYVSRPYLGMNGGLPVEAIPPQIKTMLGMEGVERGVLVQSILPDSPAAKAGIKGGQLPIQVQGPQGVQQMLLGGDIITEVNGKPVGNMTEIFEQLDEKEIGDNLEITYCSAKIDVDEEKQQLNGSVSEPKTIAMVVEGTPKPEKESKELKLDIDPNHMPQPLEDDFNRDFRFRS